MTDWLFCSGLYKVNRSWYFLRISAENDQSRSIVVPLLFHYYSTLTSKEKHTQTCLNNAHTRSLTWRSITALPVYIWSLLSYFVTSATQNELITCHCKKKNFRLRIRCWSLHIFCHLMVSCSINSHDSFDIHIMAIQGLGMKWTYIQTGLTDMSVLPNFQFWVDWSFLIDLLLNVKKGKTGCDILR